MLLMFILGCFVLPSLTEGADMKTFTCPHGRLTVTCDAGKVILIKQVKHGYYSGAFNASHCKYQVGDNTEVDDGNSKEVWENCNLQSTCSVPFIESGNYYLEMDYECVYKHTIDMLDICDTGSGTRLVAKHGYIYSPCYPNVSTWNESTYAFCQCNGTFQLPGKAEVMTLSVFHAFQETESLDVRWHAITNTPHTIRKTSPSFKTEQHATGSFDLKFSSSYRGSDWDRGFWLEFTANSPLEFKCSNTPTPKGQQSVTPPTCQLPPPATTPITTTTPTTTTPMTKTTTATPTATLSSGYNKTFTCSPEPLKATCDAGKVILIRRVKRGHYTGAFNVSHCKYQIGDSAELDDSNSMVVWRNCNLQSTCSIPFVQSGNIYLEMDYECVYKSNINTLDICDTGSGRRLMANHGYIHSPCYQNLLTWNESTHAFCQCSGTYQFPVIDEVITLSVFHAFQETESLAIRWHTITNPPQIIRNISPSFKTEQRNTGSFYLSFYSSYRGSGWDRGFWLEFTANSLLEFTCSNTKVMSPTCQTPPTTTLITSTTTPTTTNTATTTTVTLMTTAVPASTTTSSLEDVNIPAIVGLAVPLIIVSAILTSLIIILWRNGTIARLCKGHSNENTNDFAEINADCGPVYENVRKENACRSNFDNPAFVGDQNPRLTQSSDIDNSSYVNVPAMAANPTHSHNQMMPTYENIEHGKNPGSRNLDTHCEKVPAPSSGEDYSPHEEMGDTGARTLGVGTAAVSGEETESPYSRLDPVKRSEYLDLRRIGFAHQSPSK